MMMLWCAVTSHSSSSTLDCSLEPTNLQPKTLRKDLAKAPRAAHRKVWVAHFVSWLGHLACHLGPYWCSLNHLGPSCWPSWPMLHHLDHISDSWLASGGPMLAQSCPSCLPWRPSLAMWSPVNHILTPLGTNILHRITC